ncbi:hypothetical protein L228DRAFT_245414 [Xylona heveae TC161]|uniref:Uncharacterized protein n=1 Tax=Xylona heveae (strain CBS 132557 / TC161) TaxID=1328760 RepID=A0A165I6W5_XYLHT|nr:hypothetical protein L228DRAFT_245414 [Xylona heveae TC161]KZF24475.1 hypothetical protein L228DRAFT_245414 [Xylona heveae TC161]
MSHPYSFFVSTPLCPTLDNSEPASHSLNALDTPTNLSEPTPSKFARQIRRLQFRHAGGFRGLSMTPRVITPPASSLNISPSSKKTPPFYEYIPKAERCEIPAERSSPLFGKTRSSTSPLGILQEVGTTTVRRRLSQKLSRSSEVLEEDPVPHTPAIQAKTPNTGTPLFDRLQSPSERTFNGREPEPFPVPSSPNKPQTLGSPSLSISDTTPPEGQETPKAHPRPRTFSSSSEYIKHLEAQLAATHTQLELLVSPAATRTRSSKLRALLAETKALKQEIYEWEKNFDRNLEEAMAERALSNARLQARVKNLEKELGKKDGRIKELEFELETATEKVQHVDEVESSNYDLERRLDLMSELLAHSHTKLDLSVGSNWNNNSDNQKRSRPTSMLSRLPSSMETPPLAHEAAESDSEIKRVPLRLRSPNRSTWHEQTAHRLDYNLSDDLKHHTLSGDSESNSSVPLSATTISSNSSFSRPSSMTSDNSANSLNFSIPFSPLSETSPKPSQRRRRMRRFHSGSGTKSLILPATTMPQPNHPVSAPLLSTPFSEHSESDVMPSPVSLGWDSNSPYATPTQSRSLPCSMIRDDVLNLLEGGGSSEGIVTDAERSHKRSSDPTNSQNGKEHSLGVSTGRSLMDELALIGESRLGLDPSTTTTSASSTRRRVTNRSSPAAGRNNQTRNISQSYLVHQHARSPIRRKNGMVAACKLAVSEVRRNPLRLSRSVIHHAWGLVTGARTFSDFGVWILRILLGPTIARELVGRSRALWQMAGERVRQPWSNGSPIRAISPQIGNASDRGRSIEIPRPPILIFSSDVSSSAESADGGRIETERHHDDPSQDLLKKHGSDDPEEVKKASYSQKLFMWLKFSAVLTVAIGIAIKDGPAKLFAETDAGKQAQETEPDHQFNADLQGMEADERKKTL